MASTATMVTHRLTMPKKMSARLSQRAKADNTTLSAVIAQVVKEHEEMREDIADMRFAQICAERLADVKAGRDKLIPMSEIWKP